MRSSTKPRALAAVLAAAALALALGSGCKAMADPEVQNTFNVNFFGFLEMVRQICRKGRFNPGLRIVGVSSCASLRGDKSKAIYSSTKSAMDSAVRCLAKEMADKGICIIAFEHQILSVF